MSPSNVAKQNECLEEESYGRFIDSLNDGFELLKTVVNEHGNIIDFIFLKVNHAYEIQTGLRAVDLIGKRKKEAAPASEQRWYDYAISAMKENKALSYEYYNPKVNAYFDTQFIPIPPNQIAVLFKDITERKKAEQQVEESLLRYQDLLKQSAAQQEELRVIFDSSPLQSWYKDKKDRIVKVNKAFADYMHMRKEDLEGKLLREVFPPEIVRKCWEDDKKVIESSDPE